MARPRKTSPEKNRFRKYEELRSSLKTGDLVLFSSDELVGRLIRFGTGSVWSHIGMVIHIEEWELVLLWESTTLQNIKEFDSGQKFVGVQLVALSQKIREFTGRIAIRMLSRPLDKNQLETLASFRRQAARLVSFEGSKWELIRAAVDGPWELLVGQNREDLSNLFCAELIAEAYERIGLLVDGANERPSNEYTPGDFGSERRLALMGGYELGSEIEI
jgi:hypothetical protein